MFGKHVSNLTSAYCHDELSPAQSRRVAEHLISCRSCRDDFEEIKFGARLAAQLPLIAAPDSMWRGIEIALDHDRRPVLTPERRRPFSLFFKPRFALTSLALIVLVAVIAALWIGRRPGSPVARQPASNRSTWDVARLRGTPRIDSAAVDDKGQLGVGQWLETDTVSRAQIAVGDIGQVEIDPNTRVRLLETKPSEHRLELAQGRLSARISAPPKLFFVNTPSGIAEDLGCAYTLEVDDAGNSLLRVTLGWVALQLKDRESFVPAGAACVTRRGVGPGTPYFEDASQAFRSTLLKVDFDNDPEGQAGSLASLLNSARVRDTLTLWHLLGRLDVGKRARVYDRMAELTPPPQGVTRAGVLALNQQMLNAWRDELEFNWYDTSSPAMKSSRKVWTKSLGKIHGLEGKK
jgi:hypothetical protein